MRIGFHVLSEAGHIQPTLELATELEKRGHQICYIGKGDLLRKMLPQSYEVIEELQRTHNAKFADALRASVELMQEQNLGGLLIDGNCNFRDPILTLSAGIPTVGYNTTLPRFADRVVPPFTTSLPPATDWWSRWRVFAAWTVRGILNRIYCLVLSRYRFYLRALKNALRKLNVTSYGIDFAALHVPTHGHENAIPGLLST
ncbi:MAG: hypothetical protein A2289_08690 [Deltaproteobacteria bacterium RIFOXYA12_FULL_58_15]|nr:MAG: hypothetical protein A2289_08690 [Deltaproteobacteria bacterium RIFOXYA12_FULL_58_15]OGR09343.1 MAG: hypothetical protein A2341_15910 [Deltaproteobacteria bacterium RIFOXYB12_FULL_58_9]